MHQIPYCFPIKKIEYASRITNYEKTYDQGFSTIFFSISLFLYTHVSPLCYLWFISDLGLGLRANNTPANIFLTYYRSLSNTQYHINI